VTNAVWRRRIVTLAAVIWGAAVFLIVAGVLQPSIPVLGTVGTLLESLLLLHIVINYLPNEKYDKRRSAALKCAATDYPC
jgi:hypothetical protein